MAAEDENNIYTSKEQEVLDMILERRIGIMDVMCEDGVPDRVGDIRVFNELAGSIESQINTKVKMSKGLDDAGDEEKWNMLAANLLRGIDPNRGEQIPSNTQLDRTLTEKIDVEIVEGHLDVNPTALTLEKIGVKEDD